jgi:hypothetical protein
LAKEWREIKKPVQIGKIRVETKPGCPPEATIVFNNHAVIELPLEMLPSPFEVKIDTRIHQNQYVFSHRRDSGYVRMMGRVICDAQVTSSDPKMMQCRLAADNAKRKKKPSKVSGILDTPPDDRSFTAVPYEAKRKKDVRDKRMRKDESEMRLAVLSAFKQAPEWKLRDLAAQIDQSPDYVRKFVANVADFDQTTSLWKLKTGYLAAED